MCSLKLSRAQTATQKVLLAEQLGFLFVQDFQTQTSRVYPEAIRLGSDGAEKQRHGARRSSGQFYEGAVCVSN